MCDNSRLSIARMETNSLGLLTMSDIVRAHAHAAIEAGDPDRTMVPEFIEGEENLDRSEPNLD